MDKNTPLHIWVSKLDYRIDLNDQLKFEAGVKATLSDFENDVLTEFDEGAGWVIRDIFSESATFQENISAAYGSFDLKIDSKTFDTRRVTLAYMRSFGNNKVKSSRKRNTGAAEELRRVGD
jgi:hypothetical protein